jgi:hypothetical protein
MVGWGSRLLVYSMGSSLRHALFEGVGDYQQRGEESGV